MVKPRGDGPEGFLECPGSGGVEHEEDDGGTFDGAVGAADADGLDGFGGVADAGGIDEAEGGAGDVRKVVPAMLTVSSMVSRVVPAMSETMARSSPKRAFRRVLLPVLTAPTMAVGMPFLMAFPRANEFTRREMCSDTRSRRASTWLRSANSTSSSLKSSSSSISDTMSTICERISCSSEE